jgi:hypothetical protein
LKLDENGEGTLEVGDADLLPPPTDPDVGYPPDDDGPFVERPTLTPGFRYTVERATVIASRIQLGVVPDELYSDWCSLQTPILDETNSTVDEQTYGCTHNWGIERGTAGCSQTNPQTGQKVAIDCNKYDLCWGIGACSCSESGCATEVSATPDGLPVELDAALQEGGQSLVGTLVVASARIVVRMQRQ